MSALNVLHSIIPSGGTRFSAQEQSAETPSQGVWGYLPGLTCSEGSECSARAVVPHHQLPLGCTSYDDIRIRRLTQLGHMHSSLQVAVSKQSDSVEKVCG